MRDEFICHLSTEHQIATASAAIRTLAIQSGLDEQLAFEFEVALAEALNNIFEHAHAPDSNDYIKLGYLACDAHVQVTITDQGKKPLNWTISHEFPEETIEGGRGWPIILHWTDEVELFSEDNGHTLILKKYLQEHQPLDPPEAVQQALY